MMDDLHVTEARHAEWVGGLYRYTSVDVVASGHAEILQGLAAFAEDNAMDAHSVKHINTQGGTFRKQGALTYR